MMTLTAKRLTSIAIAGCVGGFCCSSPASAGSVDIPNTFQANTPAVADEVNGNFSAVETAIDDNDQRIEINDVGVERNNADVVELFSMLTAMFAGDGSAGDLNVETDESWVTDPPADPNFQNISIAEGATLTVPAGTRIRCAGDLLNKGTIKVDPVASTGSAYSAAGGSQQIIVPSTHGDAENGASSGVYDNDSAANPQNLFSGGGGRGIPRARAVTAFRHFRIGGGSGGGPFPGRAGGLVRIHCAGIITNVGSVESTGSTASLGGGGGGGIVILASLVAVDNAATISVTGGKGGDTDEGIGVGAAGGGGGGIVVFVAPSTTAGTIDVSGGAGGDNNELPFTTPSQAAGAGGGGSGGNGGFGIQVFEGSTAFKTAAPGDDGYVIELNSNPMFHLF